MELDQGTLMKHGRAGAVQASQHEAGEVRRGLCAGGAVCSAFGGGQLVPGDLAQQVGLIADLLAYHAGLGRVQEHAGQRACGASDEMTSSGFKTSPILPPPALCWVADHPAPAGSGSMDQEEGGQAAMPAPALSPIWEGASPFTAHPHCLPSCTG